jgi:ligand-binding SRPBCC domain-containing protein
MAGKRRVFKSSTNVPADIQSVWEFHSKPAALEALSPADMKVTVSDKNFTVSEGVSLMIWMSPKGAFIRFPWVSLFTSVTAPYTFTDIQTIGPFAHWRHTHSFVVSGDTTVIEDQIEYAVPGWFIGDWLIGALVARQLDEIFRYRRERLMSHSW